MKRLAIVAVLVCLSGAHAEGLRLVSMKTHESYQRLLPATEDQYLKPLVSEHLTWYDDRVMPQAYQDLSSALMGLHSIHYNISAAKPQETVGNASEFPWRHTAGMDRPIREGTGKAVRFVKLPGAIRYWRQRLPGDKASAYVWEYPAGTVFGELLCVRDPAGEWRTFEVRTRTKRPAGWLFNVYRPVMKAEDVVAECGVASTLQTQTIRNKHNLHRSVDVQGTVAMLPDLPAETVRRLLSRPFRSVKGERADGFTSSAAFNLVPGGYKGGLLRPTSESCMACHQDAQRVVDRIEKPRDWYGSVRGNKPDGILSFHIFEPSSIGYNGHENLNQIRLRRELVQAGLLKRR